MKAPLLIVLGALVLAAGSGLAITRTRPARAAITDGALQSPTSAPREGETQLTNARARSGGSQPTSPSCRS